MFTIEPNIYVCLVRCLHDLFAPPSSQNTALRLPETGFTMHLYPILAIVLIDTASALGPTGTGPGLTLTPTLSTGATGSTNSTSVCTSAPPSRLLRRDNHRVKKCPKHTFNECCGDFKPEDPLQTATCCTLLDCCILILLDA